MTGLLSLVQDTAKNSDSFQHGCEVAWEWFKTHSHIWSTALLSLVVLRRCMKSQVIPTLQQIIEVLGYSSGIYSGTQVLKLGLMKDSDSDGGIGWPLVTSGLVIIVAMLVGLTKIVREIRPVNAVPSPPDSTPKPLGQAVIPEVEVPSRVVKKAMAQKILERL
jgi:hypothetical protein